MKIDANLRQAIRAAWKTQSIANQTANRNRWDDQKSAVADLLKAKPAIRNRYNHAKSLLAKAERMTTTAHNLFYEMGLNSSGYYIANPATFENAGGILPAEPPKVWSFEQVLAKVSGASEAEALKILKAHGIVWN